MTNIYNFIAQAKYFSKKNWLQSVSILLNAIEENPNEKLLYIELAEIYSTNKQYKKSIEYYEKAQCIDRDDDYIRFKIGNNYMSLNEYKLAFIYYDEIKETFPEVLYNKAISLKNLDKSLECIETLKKLINSNPESSHAYHFLIEEFILNQSFDQALKYITIAETKFPEQTLIRYYKGLCYYYKSNYLKSFYELNKINKSMSDSKQFLHIFAKVCKHIGKIDISIEFYNKALIISPDNATLRFDLINLLLQNKQVKEAKQHIAALKDHDTYLYKTSLNILKSYKNEK